MVLAIRPIFNRTLWNQCKSNTSTLYVVALSAILCQQNYSRLWLAQCSALWRCWSSGGHGATPFWEVTMAPRIWLSERPRRFQLLPPARHLSIFSLRDQRRRATFPEVLIQVLSRAQRKKLEPCDSLLTSQVFPISYLKYSFRPVCQRHKQSLLRRLSAERRNYVSHGRSYLEGFESYCALN